MMKKGSPESEQRQQGAGGNEEIQRPLASRERRLDKARICATRPAAAAATAFFSLQPQEDALNSGYYGCIGNEMFPFKGLLAAGGAQIFEHGALDAADRLAPRMAGAFYHFTDGRFTAWGASSKVIVPRAVGGIRAGLEWAKVGGLAVTDAELAHAIYNCRGALQ